MRSVIIVTSYRGGVESASFLHLTISSWEKVSRFASEESNCSKHYIFLILMGGLYYETERHRFDRC